MSINQQSSAAAILDSTEDVRHVCKYKFDLTFDDCVNGNVRQPTFTTEQLDAAKQEGYASGYVEGKLAATEEQQNHLAAMVEKLDICITAIAGEITERHQTQMAHMRHTALLLVSKLLPAWSERYGTEEINNILTEAMAAVPDEPRLVVRVATTHLEEASTMVAEISKNLAYNGIITVLAEDAMGTSDCRVEWAEGGLERNVAAMLNTLDRILTTHSTPVTANSVS